MVNDNIYSSPYISISSRKHSTYGSCRQGPVTCLAADCCAQTWESSVGRAVEWVAECTSFTVFFFIFFVCLLTRITPHTVTSHVTRIV